MKHSRSLTHCCEACVISLFDIAKIKEIIWMIGRLYQLRIFCIIISSIIMWSGDVNEPYKCDKKTPQKSVIAVADTVSDGQPCCACNGTC